MPNYNFNPTTNKSNRRKQRHVDVINLILIYEIYSGAHDVGLKFSLLEHMDFTNS